MPKVASLVGVNADRADDNNEREIELIVALPTQRSLNIFLRIPKVRNDYKFFCTLSFLK